jgi:hypothetical protein
LKYCRRFSLPCITEFDRFQAALTQQIRVTLQTVKHRDCDKKFAGE